MAKKRLQRANEDLQAELPPGVKLLRTLEGHEGLVRSLAFDPQGVTLASGSLDRTVKIWEVRSGKLLHTLAGHYLGVCGVAFDPQGVTLASGGADEKVKIWEAQSGKLLRTLEGHENTVQCVPFDPKGGILASGSGDSSVKIWEVLGGKLLHTFEHQDAVLCVAFGPQDGMIASGGNDRRVKLWNARSGKLLYTLEGHEESIYSLAFDPQSGVLASAGKEGSIKLWEAHRGKLLRTIEGHTAYVDIVAFSPDGRLLGSKGHDGSIRLWRCETWETVAAIPEPVRENRWTPSLAFHPTLPLLATAGSEPSAPAEKRSQLIQLWELDYDLLLGKRAGVAVTASAVHHTTGKIVLLGDHSVGKSALGYRLIHDTFKEQASTHGQQFWVFPALGKRRADGTDCEAVLWDFAGQPDYRLVHALFVDNADLALVLFDASDLRDPLHGVEFWLKQLQAGESRCPIILVAAQTDRGSCPLTPGELSAFCQKHGIVGPIMTSARTGEGIAELVERMKFLIPWNDKPATVTTIGFKRVKDYILSLKEAESDGQTIVTLEEIRALLEATNANWSFTNAEILTAVGHLENYGYVKRLRTSKGELRILLQPERLNNLASSLVLEARRNPKGLGALEEKRLLAGGYGFPELKGLLESELDVLLDSAVLLFLEHNVCFRETDPLRKEPYLVFPELINLKKPPEEVQATEDGVAYTASGPTENVFSSLVVLLGYTQTFTRTAQWHNNARYEMGEGLVCGFRQESERDGELDLVLCFGTNVGLPVRALFQGLFESFLARQNLMVTRYEPVRCTNVECGHFLDRAVVRQRLKDGKAFAFCNDCGEKLTLPRMAEPILLTREAQAQVEVQRRTAEQRTRFEQAIYRVRVYVAEQKIALPECFISYAWGVPKHERWVEKQLAPDLQKAGIVVVLGRWENSRIGSNIRRFAERIEDCGYVIVVGTPLYRQKARAAVSAKGSADAAEWDLAGIRLLSLNYEERAVLPILLAGDESESFPDFLHSRIHRDFRREEAYFAKTLDLILDLYNIPHSHPAVADLRELLLE